MVADCLVSPLLEQLTALAACMLAAAPQGHVLCRNLFEVVPCTLAAMLAAAWP